MCPPRLNILCGTNKNPLMSDCTLCYCCLYSVLERTSTPFFAKCKCFCLYLHTWYIWRNKFRCYLPIYKKYWKFHIKPSNCKFPSCRFKRWNIKLWFCDVPSYLSQEEVLDESNPFVQLVSGVVWLLRNGEVYINQSLMAECDKTQETGT